MSLTKCMWNYLNSFWNISLFQILFILISNVAYCLETEQIDVESPLPDSYMKSDNITLGFCDVNPDKTGCNIHNGIDILAPSGTPVYSMCDGDVFYDNTGADYWNSFLIIKHNCNGKTIYGYYGHVSRTVSSNSVDAGQKIATIRHDSSYTDHLHLGVNTQWVSSGWGYDCSCDTAKAEGWKDPLTYLKFGGSVLSDLFGISYNSTTEKNEARMIDPVTGSSSLLKSFVFSSGWNPESLVVDVSANRFYAASGDNKLYTFDLSTGAILATPELDTHFQQIEIGKNGGLLGVSYNDTTEKNEARRIDPVAGSSSLLKSFVFSSGTWLPGSLVVDVSANRFYAASGDDKLYTFDLSTGEILATPKLDTHYFRSIKLGKSGDLVGIAINSTTGKAEARRIDPAVGSSSVLNSFNFIIKGFFATLVVDVSANRFYAASGDDKLYTFDLSTGAILATPELDTHFHNIKLGPTPSSGCPNCSGLNPVVQGVTFKSGTDCTCTGNQSLTIGPNVVIENGARATFTSSNIVVKSKMEAKAGSFVKMSR